MKIIRSKEFEKELKALTKKWRSLPKDLMIAEKVIDIIYNNEEQKRLYFSSKKATVLINKEGKEVVKFRLDCASLGSKDILRLIFIFVVKDKFMTLIEIFPKNEKNREDLHRIEKYLR